MMPRGSTRIAGWGAAAIAAAIILSSAALALATARPDKPSPLFLDLSEVPPAAPSLAAVADPAPFAVDEAPDLPDADPAREEAPPDLPDADHGPVRYLAAALTLPKPDTPVRADLALPEPEPDPAPTKPDTKPKPKPREKPKAADQGEKTPGPVKKDQARDKPTAAAGATAPDAGAKAKGGKKSSAAAYAKAVMKKVRSTRKPANAGKGAVIVGFSINVNGGLDLVRVLRSSGNAELDRLAADHIRRSAPFPAPPEGAERNFSFEFVGK